MTTPKQIFFNQWTKEEQKRLKREIGDEFEQGFKPIIKDWLQQKQQFAIKGDYRPEMRVYKELLEELE